MKQQVVRLLLESPLYLTTPLKRRLELVNFLLAAYSSKSLVFVR